MDVIVSPDYTAEQIRQFVREHPDIRQEPYDEAADPITGACYPLSEAYFHAMGGTESGLDIHCLSWSDVDEAYDGTHWFLSDDKRWIDLSLPTPADGEAIPWETGRRRAFLTGYEPSKRATRILEAIST